MKIIKLCELVDNRSLYFREDVLLIKKFLKSSEVYVDFEGIINISPSSAHELLSLMQENPKIKLVNVDEKLLKIIKSQIKLRNISINLLDYFDARTHQALA